MSLQHRLLMAARRVARLGGIDLVRANFYSPIPSRLPDDIWQRRNPLRGIKFDLDEQLEWVRQQVAGYGAEFAPPFSLAGVDSNTRMARSDMGTPTCSMAYSGPASRRAWLNSAPDIQAW